MSAKQQQQDPEVEMLRENIQGQLNRLFDQLEDLEELRDELSENEYHEERDETIQQLTDFQEFLQITFSSNMSLSTEFTPAQEAVKKALASMNSAGTNQGVSRGGQSTAKLRLLAETASSLRQRLSDLDRNLKLKLITPENYITQAGDVVLSLQASGEKLTPAEESILARTNSRHSLLTSTSDGTASNSIMASASSAVFKAQNQ